MKERQQIETTFRCRIWKVDRLVDLPARPTPTPTRTVCNIEATNKKNRSGPEKLDYERAEQNSCMKIQRQGLSMRFGSQFAFFPVFPLTFPLSYYPCFALFPITPRGAIFDTTPQ